MPYFVVYIGSAFILSDSCIEAAKSIIAYSRPFWSLEQRSTIFKSGKSNDNS